MCQLTLLSTAELLDLLLLVRDLGVERNANANTRVVLHTGRLLVRLDRAVFVTSVRLALDDQTAVTGWHELFENSCKLLGHLLKSPLYRFVLGLVQMLNQLLNRFLRSVELLASLEELLPLRGEAVVLVESLLVDVFILLERLVDFAQSGLNLFVHLSACKHGTRSQLLGGIITCSDFIFSYLPNASSGRMPRSLIFLAYSAAWLMRRALVWMFLSIFFW